jgi:hypothetical protein
MVSDMQQYKIQFPSGQPQVQPTGTINTIGLPLFRLLVAYEIFLDNCRLIVPAGFTSDFASIRPRIMRAWFNPTDPLTGPPAILHDFLCSNAILPWNMNADIFMSAMKFMGVNPIKRTVMYAAVRCAGIGNPYANVDEIIGFRRQCGIETGLMPLCWTVEELSMLAKQHSPAWAKSI